MADFYLDISAIGNEYQSYSDTPTTWGVPQDGNGKAGPGHAAAVAIATISCASASASGAGSLSLLGVTVSSTLTGSGATLATNITTAINASTTAVTATYSQALLPLNKLVFARVNPELTTQVQIMLRIAGEDWNGMLPVSGGTWGTAPTMGAFSGGANGPFAYFIATSAVFGKSIADYGTAFALVGGVSEPGTTDVVHCRVSRSASNLALTYSVSTGTSKAWKNRNYLFDDGTLWSGDTGKMVVTLKHTHVSATALSLTFPASGVLTFCSRGKHNIEIQAGATGNTGAYIVFAVGGASSFFRFDGRFIETSDCIGAVTLYGDQYISTANNQAVDLSGAFVQYRGSVDPLVWISGGGPLGYNIRLNGLVCEVVAAVGPIGKLITAAGSTASGRIDWIGGEVRDSNGVYSCQMPFNVATNNTAVHMLTVDGVAGITDPAVGFAASSMSQSFLSWISAEGATKGYRLETPTYVIDWKGNGTFPVAGSSATPQGTAWSHRLSWTSNPSLNLSVTPFRFARIHRAASAVRTVTLDLYVPNATTIYLDELEFAVTYLDSTDVLRTEVLAPVRTLQLLGSGRTALPASATSWAANGVANYSAKKVELTTTYQVKQNSEVIARLSLCTSRGSTIVIYASPEIGVA